MPKQLHIVCFDAPAPAHYGGVIDLYYKIIALANAGVHITLHYFQYKAGRGHQGLEPFCKAIYVYPRKPYWQCMASPLPFIVGSRINKDLINRLNEDQHPVLLEGIHCSGMLPYLHVNRKIMLRLHNNEATYYRRLAHIEHAPLRNLYYTVEATRLDRYQKRLPPELACAAVSLADMHVVQNLYGWTNTRFLPAFIPWQMIHPPEGLGDYCLYQGNLSITENEAAVRWLIRHVFAGSDIPFIIAGQQPSERLKKAVAPHPKIRLVVNPSDKVLDELIGKAQVNVLPSLNETGVKLKVLHALFYGRHCVTNGAAVAGSGLETAVHLEEEAASLREKIKQLMQQPFTQKEMQQRKSLLHQYDNVKNAQALIAWIC